MKTHPALSHIENGYGYTTLFSLHPNVRKLAEFMLVNFPKEELRSAARGLATIAPILWDRHADNGWGPLDMQPLGTTGFSEPDEGRTP